MPLDEREKEGERERSLVAPFASSIVYSCFIESIKKARSSCFAPWNDGPGRLTHRHGDVNPVFAALDQQREGLALRSFVDQLLELLSGLDHLAIDREHDVAFLNAGLGRRTLNCAPHHYAAFDFELLFLLGRQILYRESKLAG